jgi:hypothetical protein
MKQVEIFKLQRPLAGAPQMLAYNKKRDKQFQMPMSEDLLEFMGEDFKIYVYAKVHFGQFKVTGRAPDQDW